MTKEQETKKEILDVENMAIKIILQSGLRDKLEKNS